MVKVSAVIITFNEADNIAAACQSVEWADEILVVDSESTDDTAQIARSCGAKVISQAWLGFGRQKQFAAEQAAHDWIFSLDADERLSDELRVEILRLKELSDAERADGYQISRRTRYMNRWIRGGGWYPDWQLRFYNCRKGRWKDVGVHESITMQPDTKIVKINRDLLHYSIPNAAYHNRMIAERYAPLAAEKMFAQGKRATVFKIYTAGITAFLQTYILKLGWRDGLAGFCIARFAAHHAFLKYLLLREMQKGMNEREE